MRVIVITKEGMFLDVIPARTSGNSIRRDLIKWADAYICDEKQAQMYEDVGYWDDGGILISTPHPDIFGITLQGEEGSVELSACIYER